MSHSDTLEAHLFDGKFLKRIQRRIEKGVYERCGELVDVPIDGMFRQSVQMVADRLQGGGYVYTKASLKCLEDEIVADGVNRVSVSLQGKNLYERYFLEQDRVMVMPRAEPAGAGVDYGLDVTAIKLAPVFPKSFRTPYLDIIRGGKR